MSLRAELASSAGTRLTRKKYFVGIFTAVPYTFPFLTDPKRKKGYLGISFFFFKSLEIVCLISLVIFLFWITVIILGLSSVHCQVYVKATRWHRGLRGDYYAFQIKIVVLIQLLLVILCLINSVK